MPQDSQQPRFRLGSELAESCCQRREASGHLPEGLTHPCRPPPGQSGPAPHSSPHLQGHQTVSPSFKAARPPAPSSSDRGPPCGVAAWAVPPVCLGASPSGARPWGSTVSPGPAALRVSGRSPASQKPDPVTAAPAVPGASGLRQVTPTAAETGVFVIPWREAQGSERSLLKVGLQSSQQRETASWARELIPWVTLAWVCPRPLA